MPEGKPIAAAANDDDDENSNSNNDDGELKSNGTKLEFMFTKMKTNADFA